MTAMDLTRYFNGEIIGMCAGTCLRSMRYRPDEHLRWFERAEGNANRHLLMFEKDGTPSGFVAFHIDSTGETADWGFYAAPEAPKGTGRILGQTAVQYAFFKLKIRKLRGQTLARNYSSIDCIKCWDLEKRPYFDLSTLTGKATTI